MEEIEKAGPFGAGNPEPVFVLPEHKIIDVMPFGADHLRVRVQSGDGASWNSRPSAPLRAVGSRLIKAQGRRAHLACALSLDHWGGKARVSARLLDLAFCRRA